MQEVCPICGSKKIEVVDRVNQKYHCVSCDEVFTLSNKPIIKTVIHKVIEKRTTPLEISLGLSAKEVYKKNIDRIVEINAVFGDTEMNGTGFFVTDTGCLITNAHVVVTKKESGYVLCDNVYVCKSRSVDYIEARIEYLDPKNDLALLKVSGSFDAVALADRTVEVGDKVFAIGNSRGDGLALLDGIVSDTERKFKAASAFLFNALVTHGCSGGPVFNDRGEVCGVTVGSENNTVGMNYAIPISTVRAFIEKALRK